MSLSTSVVLVGSLDTHAVQDTEARGVRFDSECVLIPECSHFHKRSRVVTKSYSLPLWRRRSQPTSDSDCTDDGPTVASTSSTAPFPSSPEETHVVLKLPIPSFIRRSSCSPSRGRSPSSSPTIPLLPCLVHRSPSGPPSSHSNVIATPNRRPSLPIYQRRKDGLTVPLRECCLDCAPIIEKSLEEGSSWQEKFTKGARRRRSASLDNSRSSAFMGSPVTATKPSFSPNLYDERMPPPTLAITVDEVDKRRKSLEEHPRSVTSSSSSVGTCTLTRGIHSFGVHDRDHSTDSASSSSLTDTSEREQLPKRKSSPIAEEDENELFPLPSPRRSPSASPSPSTGSSPKPSRTPSPNTSTACLHPSSAATSSATSVPRHSLKSEEVLGDAIISRKDKGKEKGKAEEPIVDSAPQSGSSTPQGPKPFLTLSFLDSISNNNGGDTEPNSPTSPVPASLLSTSSTTSTQPRSPITPSSPPKALSMTTGKNRKNSFTLPFLKATEAIKGASVDVLKGVGSIGGNGGGGGIMGAV